MEKVALDGRERSNIKIGTKVMVVKKEDQRTENLTEGFVARILTNTSFHPHGIKVELLSGTVGRVQKIIG